MLNNLGEKKQAEDDRYQRKFYEIKQKEMDDKKKIDSEIEDLRKQGLK